MTTQDIKQRVMEKIKENCHFHNLDDCYPCTFVSRSIDLTIAECEKKLMLKCPECKKEMIPEKTTDYILNLLKQERQRFSEMIEKEFAGEMIIVNKMSNSEQLLYHLHNLLDRLEKELMGNDNRKTKSSDQRRNTLHLHTR